MYLGCNNHSSDLVGSLEELGLSKYEAGAYLTMIRKGSLAASEIAYYANLPRTKVYSTLKKLEKKRLSIISQQKPLICSAIPPEEAFSEIVKIHERRLKNTKKIVDTLQRIIDQQQKPRGSEERRYFILDPNSTMEKMENLISGSRFSINAILDGWGIRIMSQCKSSLIRAITKNVKVRFILPNQCIGNESLFSLPEDIEMRVGDVISNTIIIDSNNLISIDSSNGKAAVFTSLDIFGLSQLRGFEIKWNNAMDLGRLKDIEPDIVTKAINLTNIVENGISNNNDNISKNYNMRPSIHLQLSDSSTLIKSMEKSGIKIANGNVTEFLNVSDCALKIGYSGGLKYDKTNNIVSIQTKADNTRILQWAFLLCLYFKCLGNDSQIMQNSSNGSDTEVIHIKLSKSAY